MRGIVASEIDLHIIAFIADFQCVQAAGVAAVAGFSGHLDFLY